MMMSKERTVPKIWYLETPERSHRRRGTVRRRRRETNQQIMQDSIRDLGFIRINIPLRMRHVLTGTYAGWNGAALTLDVPSIEKATEFHVKLQEAVSSICRELGLKILTHGEQ